MRPLPSRARTFPAVSELFEHLRRYHKIEPNLASTRLHRIKDAVGRRGGDDVLLDRTGGVYDPATREPLGSLTEGGTREHA